MNYEELMNAFIGIDGPVQVMNTYEEVTGKDPVTEDGQHTDDFRHWWLESLVDALSAGITDPKDAVKEINKITRKDIVSSILDKCWETLVARMEDASIKFDASSGDSVLFYNDKRLKKTFAVHIDQTECEEYEGEYVSKLYLVCHENGGFIENGVLYRKREDAIADIRARRVRDLAYYKSNDPTDGYWIDEDKCYAHPSGYGYVSIWCVNTNHIHGDCDHYYAVNFDDGGSIFDVDLWCTFEEAQKDLYERIRSWNKTHDNARMERIADCHYDNNDGLGFILNDKLEVK